jgi:hypothetical protein
VGWFWPEIYDRETAKDAARRGAWVALIVAALTALLAVLSLALETAILGVTPPSLLDAAIFAVVSWRIFKMWRAWAVTGMVIYLAEVLYGLRHGRIGVIAVVFLFAFLNAIRGTFAFHRLPPQQTDPAGARLLGGRL